MRATADKQDYRWLLYRHKNMQPDAWRITSPWGSICDRMLMSIQYQAAKGQFWSAVTVSLSAFCYTRGRLDRGRARHAPLPTVLNETTERASSLGTNLGSESRTPAPSAPFLGGMRPNADPQLASLRAPLSRPQRRPINLRITRHRCIATIAVPSLHGLAALSTLAMVSETVPQAPQQ